MHKVFGFAMLFTAAFLVIGSFFPNGIGGSKAPKSETLTSSNPALLHGQETYKWACAGCHDGGDPGAPLLDTVKLMDKGAILTSLTTGKMAQQGEALSEDERTDLIAWLTKGQKDVRGWESALKCSNETLPKNGTPSISRWGFDANNHRVNRVSRLASRNVKNFTEAWTIAFPGTSTMRSQPVVLGDRLFLAVADTQSVYAFNRNTGCLDWSYKSDSSPRSALTLAKWENQDVILYGDTSGYVTMLSTQDGSEIWRQKVGINDKTTITGPVQVAGNKIIVPHSSTETIASVDPNYECCKLSGGVTAHRLSDGETLWTFRTVREAEKREVSAAGTQLWGPSGASVWAAPLVDEINQMIFVGTGPISAPPDEGTGDAIIAIGLNSGERDWTYQATKDDLWNGACRAPHPDGKHPNCPGTDGVDFDFGAGIIRAPMRNGPDLILAGQKSGVVHALNAKTGELIWQKQVGSGGLLGGIHWGMAYEDGALYVPVNDPDFTKHPSLSQNYKDRMGNYVPKSGIYRLNALTGEVEWSWAAKPACDASFNVTETWPDCPPQYGQSSAIQIVGDMILAGGMDGRWRALDKHTGNVLAEYDTYKPYTNTLNGVEGHGGSIDNASMIFVDDMAYIQTGYGYFGGTPGNVLIAYKLRETP